MSQLRLTGWAVPALAVLAAFVIALSTAAPAAAAEGITVRKADTINFPTVALTVLPPALSSGNEPVIVKENGLLVRGSTTQTLTEANVPVGVVLVIDTSAGMTDGAALDKAKTAAVAMVQTKAPNEHFAVVATNSEPRPVVNFTQDATLLINGINSLSASGDNALWRGAQVAAGLLANSPELQANVVILNGTPDRLSASEAFGQAQSQLETVKAVVFSVAISQRQSAESEGLQSLAAATRGRYVETGDPSAATRILAGIGKTVSSQEVITYRSQASGSLGIEVVMGAAAAEVRTRPGTVSEGNQLNAKVVKASPLPEFLNGATGMILITVAALAGIGLLCYGIFEIVARDRRQLASALRPYSNDIEDEKIDISKLADSAIIKRAVASTGRIAQERGLLDVVRRRLEQADMPLKPAEALFFTAVSAIVAMLIGAAAFGIIGLAVAGFVFAFLPVFITSVKASRRKKRFTSQLPDTLQLLSGSLRAGYSLVQGMDAVSKQCEMPMAGELQRAMNEARLGRPIEEALQDVSDRMASDDFEWAVMAIKIQREVGGNLSELLMTVSETMVQRERLRREVKALTAEGRISAIVLSLLPPIIGGVIGLLNPAYMTPLLSNFVGQAALVAAGVMIVVGYFVMNKLCEIEA